MKVTQVATGIIFLFFLSSCTRYVWVSKGPANLSGAIQYITTDPSTYNRLYANSENGGLWVLNDVENIGAGWKPISDKLENLQMRGFAKDREYPNYIVVGNMLGFIYHTKDHGVNWQRICNDNFGYIRKITISITNNNNPLSVKLTKILVACSKGLYEISLSNDAFVRVDTLYPSADVTDLVKSTDGKLYIGVRKLGVFRSIDRGRNWENIMPWAGRENRNTSMIKMANSSDNQRLVVKMGMAVYANDNDGNAANWNLVFNLRGIDNKTSSDVSYRSGGLTTEGGDWNHAIAISPTNKNVIIVGHQWFFVSSLDTSTGLLSFKTVIRYGHEDVKSFAFNTDGTAAYIATDGGIFKYNIEGENPDEGNLNKGLATYQFYRLGVKGNNAVGNADHNGLKGTINLNANEPTWVKANNGTGGNGLENNFIYVDPVRTNTYYQLMGTELHRLIFDGSPEQRDHFVFSDKAPNELLLPYQIKLYNDDASLFLYNQLNYDVNTIAVDPRSADNGIILASVESTQTGIIRTYGIKITRNANNPPTGLPGEETNIPHWVYSHRGNTTPIASIAFALKEPGRVYAIDEAGKLITKTEVGNDNEPWRVKGTMAIEPTDFVRQLATHISDSKILFALANRRFASSLDSGRTWTTKGQSSLPAIKLNSICTHPTESNTLYIGTDRGVYISENGGNNWRLFDEMLPNAPVMQVFVDGKYLYAVTFGRGVWRIKVKR